MLRHFSLNQTGGSASTFQTAGDVNNTAGDVNNIQTKVFMLKEE